MVLNDIAYNSYMCAGPAFAVYMWVKVWEADGNKRLQPSILNPAVFV